MSQKARITVYRTRGCPFCVAAEQMLEEHELEFEQIYLDVQRTAGNGCAR
ncbi:MAG: glutaredoxin family protein [Planctomycetota bacterium]|jgi:glutaredoxin